jgi:hypothetical protein
MMIDRRFTLKVLLTTAAGGLAGAVRAAVSPDPAAEQFENALARLGARADSEPGIPVFLAGEDLAAEEPAGSGAPAEFSPDTLNRRLAAAYGDYAALLPSLERERTEYDAALLVELLAEQDFLAGGK